MRILVLSDLYPPYHKGGHEVQCKFMVDGLSQKGYDVSVLTSKYGVNGKKANGKIFRLLEHIERGESRAFRRRYEQIKIALLGRLNYFIARKIIKDLRPDIVYAGELSYVSIYPIKAIQIQGVPIVYHLGTYYFRKLVEECMLEENAIKRFYRQFIFGFNGLDKFDFRYIITVSEAVKRKYVEVGFRERDISVIPPLGIPIELIPNEYKRTSRAKNNLLKLLYVGRIVKEKGVHVAIESVGYMINNLGMNNLNLDIIGEGDLTYMEYLYGLIETLKLKDYVNFRKGMSRDEVLRQYRNYDILVVPSIWEEPFGIIILEAMSQGIPVVATSVGGIPEIIEAEKVGILVPPNDPITMALAIKKLIDNPSLSKKISGNGISLIHNKYTDETIINQIDHYLKNVVLWEQSAKSCKTA